MDNVRGLESQATTQTTPRAPVPGSSFLQPKGGLGGRRSYNEQGEPDNRPRHDVA